MRIDRKGQKLNERWVKWFAWFPVTIEDSSSYYRWSWVWLEHVERKQVAGYGGVHYRYRDIIKN